MTASQLARTLRALRAFYGPPPPPISRDPFQLILWEQVAYLVPDATRRRAFDALRTRVGLAPREIFHAGQSRLTAITRLGGSIAPWSARRVSTGRPSWCSTGGTAICAAP